MNIEKKIVDLIEGRTNAPFLRSLLFAFSLLYKKIIQTRHFLYDNRWLKREKNPTVVVSVGNIVAGGTGKTPFVKKLVQDLLEKGNSVAVLSRGYRSKAENSFVLASKGTGPLVDASICGDEPYLLACQTKASVWVGKNRCWSARQAAKFGAKILVLEDGFQYQRMQKDIEIVLLDSTDLWGKGFFLPRGYLRDLPARLAKADFVVITRLEETPCVDKLKEEIRRFTKAPLFGVSGVYFLKNSLVGKKVGAFCGIAKPSFFYKTLEKQGVEIVKTFSMPDHKAPDMETLSAFALECKKLGAEALVCTEKDSVKLQDLSMLILPVDSLKMELKCTWNGELWDELLQSIQRKM